jgi:hypothetical protein
MKKVIVTTTIQPPTKATILYAQKPGWNFIIVGDRKTPHQKYFDLQKKYPSVIYLHPDDQTKSFPKISELIGWNCIQRRNIGFIEAYKMGAEIIATVDDDNLPYDSWGKDIKVNQTIEIDLYQPKNIAFDPLSVTNVDFVWHRGYPIQDVPYRKNVQYLGKLARKVLVQANFWDGDPDIDAIARLSHMPIVKFDQINFFGSTTIAPFNSQNTILSREILPDYAVFPHIGRMDDIWGAYILQHHHPNSVVFGPATVYQERNKQDLIRNLENELIGYRETLKLISDLNTYEAFLPSDTKKFWHAYRQEFIRLQ